MTRTFICVALALTAATCAVWPAQSAADERAQAAGAGRDAPAPPVTLHILTVTGGLRVDRVADGGGWRAAASEGLLLGAPGLTSGAATLDAGRRFTMAGLTCAPPAAPGVVTVQLRSSLDGRDWSRWLRASLESAAEAGGTPRAFTEPLWTGAARYVQVRAVAGAGAPGALKDVRLVTLDSGVGDRPAVGARSAAHAAPRAGTASARAVGERPRIVSRKQWGADESLRGARPKYAKVKMAFVHHTASGNDYSAAEAPAVMRGIYAYHTRALGWSDVGYNFLIDRFGTIYEGRHGGIRRGVIGAQVLGFNRGSTGISVIGNYADDAPPAEALAALHGLLAWKLKIHHLRPTGSARLRCDYGQKFATGQKVTFPVVAGHRQANFTECPGAVMYPLLPAIRLEAAGRPQPPIISLAKASPSRFSPNDDGSVDTTELKLWLTKAASWSIELRDSRGERLGSFGGDGSSGAATWKGLGADGRAFRDGAYTAVVSASSELGAAATRRVALTIDTVAPGVGDVAAEPDRFSPNGDGSGDSTKLRYVLPEACSARVSVLDAGGTVVRRLTDWRSQTAGAHSATWPGEVTRSGGRAAKGGSVAAPEGDYRLLVECRDAAGNSSRKTAPVAVDRTLGFLAAEPQTFSPNGDDVLDTTALGFKLTRAATVRVVVKVDGRAVRTMRLGELDAGAREAVWDGTTDAGAPVGSCRPRFTVTASSALGSISATAGVVADLERPVLSAPATTTVARGKQARLTCTARDAYSAQVRLSYTIRDAAGVTVAAASRGWVTAGRAVDWTWRPPAPGVYTVTFAATDRGGNRELTPAVTVLTMRE